MATPNTIPPIPTYYNGSGGSFMMIQNLATAPLYVKFGAGCSASDFNLILPACGVANDGTSSPYSQNFYFGTISVFPASGSASYIAEFINSGETL